MLYALMAVLLYPKSKTRKGTLFMSNTTNAVNATNATKITKTAEEKLAEKNARIKQLQKQKQAIIKRENAKERKARNHRLCRRHGLLEKLFPDIINITDEQFEAFIRTHIRAKHGRGKLAEIVDKGAEAAAAYIAKCRVEDEARAKAEAEQAETHHASDNKGSRAESHRNNGTDGSTNQAQSAQSEA